MSIESVTGKLLWLRGQDLGASGSAITTWVNQAPSGGNATGVNTAQLTVEGASTPLGGKAAAFGTNGSLTYPVVTVTASSQFGSEPATNAVDQAPNSYWTTNASVTGWIRLDYGDTLTITAYRIRRRDAQTTRNPSAWTFEGSDDGTTWTTLDTQTGQTWPTANEYRTYTLGASETYSKYRLNITANTGDATYTSLAEFNVVPAGVDMWVVVKSGATSSSRALWRAGESPVAGDAALYPYGTDSKVYEAAGLTAPGNRQSFTPTVSIGSWRIYRVRNDNTTWQAWLDGTSQATASNKPAYLAATFLIGLANSINFSGGCVAELLVFNHALDSTESADVFTYLTDTHITAPTVTDLTSPTATVDASADVADIDITTPTSWLMATEPNAVWRADSLTLADGDPVAAWQDSSGNDFTATASTYLYEPTFAAVATPSGKPAVRFSDFTGYLWSMETADGGDQTVLAVVKLATGGGQPQQRTIVSGGVDWVVEPLPGGLQAIYKNPFPDPFAQSNTTVPDGVWTTLVMSFTNGVGYTFRRNGAADGSGSFTLPNESDNTIIGLRMIWAEGGYHPFRGDIALIAKWTSVLDPATIAMIEAEVYEQFLITSQITSPDATATATAVIATVELSEIELTSPAATATASAVAATFDVITDVRLTSPAATATATATVALLDDLSGWTADLTGRALVGVDTSITDLYVPAPVVDPPGHVQPVPLIRNSFQLANLTGTHRVHTAGEQQAVNTREVLGVAHVWVDGVDRTYDQDGEVVSADNLVSEKGLGDRSAKVTVRGQQVWDTNGAGGYPWLVAGAEVEVGIVTPTGARLMQWAGDLISDDAALSDRSFDATWLAQGPLVQAMQAMHQPLDRMDPTDIGTVIPRVLNGVLSRRYPPIPTVTTGITTTKLGSYGQRVGDYVRTLLATAWEGDAQWGLVRSGSNPRQYRMVLTDTATIHWNLTAGAHGVTANLSRDFSQVTNVIYGRGTMPSGYYWMNRKYPYLLPYAPPGYFSGNTSAELLLGDTDADTINNGVTLLQNRLRELGYRVAVTGVMTQQTVDVVRRLQRDRGLTVDGRVGGQTWTSIWSIGATGADLRSVRLPLASDPRVEPYQYHTNGAIAGNSPSYDPDWPRLEDDIDYGENTTLGEGVTDAQQRVARLKEPSVSGTLTLATCPWEGARWLIQPGHNVRLHGWRGTDVALHVADVTHNRVQGTVNLTVDSAFRDALTVHEVTARNAESKADPSRRPGAIGRTRSTSAPDMTTPFDGESPAGILPELTLRGGLWSVWPLALDQVGTLARVVARTYDPVTRFGMLLFGREVMPNQIAAGVGNILGTSRPWSDPAVSAFLDDNGFIEGWGQDGQACGYYPGTQGDGDPVTGEFRSTSGVSYVSEVPPFIWVAILPAGDCRIRAEFDPQPKG